MDVNRQLQKKDKKRKMLIDQQRLKKEDVSEEEELNNDDVRVGPAVKKTTVKFADDDGDVDMSDSEDDGLFINPLLSSKKNGSKSNKPGENADNDEKDDGFSSADEADEKMLQKEKKKKEDKLIGKRKRRGDEEEDDVGDFFANTEIEVVPQTKIRERTKNAGSDDEDAGYSSMDSEEMAETRALAKVMLRKKNRNEIIEGTYNRYAVHEDPSTLPDWFIEDEMRHFRANNVHLVTKDMVAEEKKLLKAYNERPSKKVQEAKARKKKRLAKAMNKIKTKATVIAEQQEISEGTKMRQIQKLYKKEKAKNKEEKNYVVSRNFSNIGGSKTPRNTKAVDKRMKKDRRALKARAKKDKKRNGGGRRK
jgi:AdoMet-dependent rRNA methyltransferase SPB1